MARTAAIVADPVVSFRLRALRHQQEYGWRAACDAFQVGRTTLYRWRSAYLRGKQHPACLKKLSTRPHRLRPMEIDPMVVEYIRRLRQQHFRLGKEKIKPLLDEFCRRKDLSPIAVSTIGKVIKRHHLFFQPSGRIYHRPGKNVHRKRPRLRSRYSWLPREIGHLQVDTVVKLIDSLHRYAISVIDIRSKASLTLVYPSLTSATALDALMKFQAVYRFPVLSVQTDNGLEFQGVFDRYLHSKGIPHYFTYPRCPKINAFIERYNRTFQEEFLDPNLHLIHHPKTFHRKLLEYLVFFNTKRVHQGLGNLTPMDYLISQGYFSQMYVTRTQICILRATLVQSAEVC